jgi:hypothetical protein
MSDPSTPGQKRLIYRLHAVQRMLTRGISEADIAQIVAQGKAIEDYPSDWPYPSKLVLGWLESRPIHVVFAESSHEIIVITVYEPDPNLWESGFEKRKP